MKFSSAIRGKRAEKPASFTDLVESEKVHTFALRPLTAMEEIDAVAMAIAVSKQKGSAPEPGKAIYDETLMAAIVAASCVDVESPAESREAFFPGGYTQILESLDGDTIASLHEQQGILQEEASPSFRNVSVGELYAIAKELVEGVENNLPFDQLMRICLRLSPKTRLTLLLFMAAQLRQLPAFKPPSSSPSEPGPASPKLINSDEEKSSDKLEPSEKPPTGETLA